MKLKKVYIRKNGYLIYVGSGILNTFPFEKFAHSAFIIIGDTRTYRLFGRQLEKRLRKKRTLVHAIQIPSGEKSKSLDVVGRILRKLAKKNIDCDAIILLVGGGVVGDIGVLTAALYKRGIRYIHIPTTLLAQVDSSIGGKGGVNLPEGKNLAGIIYRPQAVICDIDVLHALPEQHILQGLAEVIKCAVMYDAKLFKYLEKNIHQRDLNFYAHVVERTAFIKSRIVLQDEQDHGYRSILNYGHTIGHALEIISHFSISHGEAVAIGMSYEGMLAVRLGILRREDIARQDKLLLRAGLPIRLQVNKFSISKMIEIMRRDKKSRAGSLSFVFPKAIGSPFMKRGALIHSIAERTVRTVIEGKIRLEKEE